MKNHRAISGKTSSTTSTNSTIPMDNCAQNPAPTSPCVIPTTTASTSSDSTSVTIVPPSVMLTAGFLEMPILLMYGYTIRVCEEKRLENKTVVSRLNPST